jgi:hypothetical protein
LCAIVLYKKRIKGRLYPKAARIGPYAFAQEVTRVNGKVVTKYIGIMKVQEDTTVIETEEERRNDHPTSEPESLQQTLF